jgi:hypothetical protein
MSFRCFSCGISFDTVAKFVEHKFVEHRPGHQEQPERDMILRCGKPTSASASKAKYGGDSFAPIAGQPKKVVIQKVEGVTGG